VDSTDTSRISPTAHYTSYVWFRNGMSHPALISTRGRLLHSALAPANLILDKVGGRPNLDMMLLGRHRAIDHLLAAEIDAGRVRHVVEVAAGLSPRGFRFARRYPEVSYIEGDLPESATRKRRLLDEAGLRGANHDVVAINALVDDGPDSLAAACARLPPGGTALITEGLLGYFDPETVAGVWRRFARALAARGGGVYLTDLNLRGDATPVAVLFTRVLSLFARGRVYLHFDRDADAEAAMRGAGFDEARIVRPADLPDIDVPRKHDGHQVCVAAGRVNPGATPPETR
jgi:O-methyltransferase involved in polyketide biosynthesis